MICKETGAHTGLRMHAGLPSITQGYARPWFAFKRVSSRLSNG